MTPFDMLCAMASQINKKATCPGFRFADLQTGEMLTVAECFDAVSDELEACAIIKNDSALRSMLLKWCDSDGPGKDEKVRIAMWLKGKK